MYWTYVVFSLPMDKFKHEVGYVATIVQNKIRDNAYNM